MSWIVLALVLGLLICNSPVRADNNNQSSKSQLCLDPSLIQNAAKTDGITNPANPDRFAKSLTSSNNFLDFCRGSKLTNGAQVEEGSCNPTPMGSIPSVANMPSVRIIEPSPSKILPANTDFNVVITTSKMQFGFFTSPTNTYYLAPQQLNSQGQITGHIHITVQQVIENRNFQTDKVVLFKGISDPAVNGKLNATFTGGLPPGFYRISTMTSAMNHQALSLPVARRGSVDDAIYVQVGSAGSSRSTTSGGNSVQSISDPSQGEPQTKQSLQDVSSNGSSQQEPTNKKKHKSKKVCRVKRRKA